jgi:hypothetical protein
MPTWHGAPPFADDCGMGSDTAKRTVAQRTQRDTITHCNFVIFFWPTSRKLLFYRGLENGTFSTEGTVPPGSEPVKVIGNVRDAQQRLAGKAEIDADRVTWKVEVFARAPVRVPPAPARTR